MVAAPASLDTLCINSIRFLAVDAVNKSKSGHPGLPMGCAPMGYTLWDKFLKHNPKNPKWFNRDRFVLSAGHGCMLLYALLHLTGYDSVSIDDIKARNYNLDIKNPFESEQVSHDPDELLAKYEQQQAEIQEIRHQLRDILADALSHNRDENTDGGAA